MNSGLLELALGSCFWLPITHITDSRAKVEGREGDVERQVRELSEWGPFVYTLSPCHYIKDLGFCDLTYLPHPRIGNSLKILKNLIFKNSKSNWNGTSHRNKLKDIATQLIRMTFDKKTKTSAPHLIPVTYSTWLILTWLSI